MPLTCPHCQIVQAEGNEACINCGLPLMPAGTNMPAETAASQPDEAALAASDAANVPLVRRASWRLPAVVACGLLLAVAASAFFAAQHPPARRTAVMSPAFQPPPSPPVPKEHVQPLAPSSSTVSMPPPSTAARTPTSDAPRPSAEATPLTVMPLTVLLDSTREGRHVKVGEDVTLTALARGRSATLTLFYRRGHGEKIMLTFVEGSLCSTTWTPPVPGRYEFTATARDDRRQSADSRRVEITVDAPVPPVEARAPSAPPPRVAAAPPPAVRPTRRPLRTAAPDTASAGGHPPPLTYHVAAAKFPFLRNAIVLADALRRRGYPAMPERMDDAHGKTVYVVVTGTYRRPKEARAATLDLQRSGYPAYFFGNR